MKSLFSRLATALAFTALVALPAAAADAPASPAAPDAAVETVTLDFLNDAVQTQNGPPADLPNRGHACELPPQQQNEECICPLVFDPVCGCNGETYSNSCFASCEVRSWSEGECDGTTS